MKVKILVSAIVVCLTATALNAQDSPPAPRRPVTNLQLPEALFDQDIKTPAILPQGARMAFAFEMEGRARTGDLNISANITSIKDNRIELKTDKGKPAGLLFRLPGKLKLNIESGSTINLKRKVHGFKAQMGEEVLLLKNATPLLASGRFFSDRLQKIPISRGLEIRQQSVSAEPVSVSKYESTFAVNTVLLVDGTKHILKPGEDVRFKHSGNNYLARLLNSSRTVPAEKFIGVSEGAEFSLEFVLLKL